MIDIVAYPSKIVNEQPTEVSKWNAVHHPIQFQMQRKDVTIGASYRYDATHLEIQINGPVEGVVGDMVYFNSGIFVSSAEITHIISDTPTLSTIRVLYSTTSTYVQLVGFLNWLDGRPNYFVETMILGVNSTPAYYEVGTSINKADNTGLVKVDAADFLKKIVAYANTFQYDELNKADTSMGGKFNIQYREGWTGSTGSWSGISATNLYYYVNAAKQVKQIYGANMGEYVPFETAFDTEDKAKFLSDFRKPTYFPGYPFDLQFIYSDAVAGRQLVKFERTKDLNGSTIGTSSADLDTAYLQSVNRMMITSVECDVKEMDVWLETDGVGCREYVVDDYVAEDYVEERCGPIEVDTGDAR